jgi:hypothetical protein
MTRPWFYGRVALVAGAVLALTLTPTSSTAQFAVVLNACKKLILLTRDRGPTVGDPIAIRECGTRFSAQDAYVALVIRLRQVVDPMEVGMQLLDPSGTSLWAARTQVDVEPGSGYDTYWIYVILPLAAELRALVAEDPRLALSALSFPGRPARERPGEWTLRVSINRGAPTTLRFVVEAATAPAPPAPTPSPSPSS